MLRHVGREEDAPQRVERRDQRHDAAPASRRRSTPPASGRIPCPAPARRQSRREPQGVERAGEGEEDEDERVPGPPARGPCPASRRCPPPCARNRKEDQSAPQPHGRPPAPVRHRLRQDHQREDERTSQTPARAMKRARRGPESPSRVDPSGSRRPTASRARAAPAAAIEQRPQGHEVEHELRARRQQAVGRERVAELLGQRPGEAGRRAPPASGRTSRRSIAGEFGSMLCGVAIARPPHCGASSSPGSRKKMHVERHPASHHEVPVQAVQPQVDHVLVLDRPAGQQGDEQEVLGDPGDHVHRVEPRRRPDRASRRRGCPSGRSGAEDDDPEGQEGDHQHRRDDQPAADGREVLALRAARAAQMHGDDAGEQDREVERW